MQLSRLIQPRRPAFWLMLVLNVMTMVLVWVVELRALEGGLRFILLSFALGNAVLGMVLAWRLMKGEGETDVAANDAGDAAR